MCVTLGVRRWFSPCGAAVAARVGLTTTVNNSLSAFFTYPGVPQAQVPLR